MSGRRAAGLARGRPGGAAVTVLSGARVVAGDRVLDRGWVRVEGERIVEVGDGAAPDGGRLADLVVLNDDLAVRRVMRHGQWV